MKPTKKPLKLPKVGEHTGHPVRKQDLNENRLRAIEEARKKKKEDKK